MDRLALFGASHRRGGASVLETWQKHWGEISLHELVAWGFTEAARLSTCNRFDLLVVLPAGMELAEARRRLVPSETEKGYVYVGEGAVEQLCRIASSLDSLNPGEDQIMMQVREAYAEAEHAGTLGKQLRFAFTSAFRVAKRVRREVALAPLHTSLFSLARPEMELFLPEQARIGILGTGKMGRLAARSLCERPHTELWLINRRVERAQALADELKSDSVHVMELSAFQKEPPSLDGLVCATSVASIVGSAELEKLKQLRVIVDLGLPRNVTPRILETYSVAILDVDTLQKAGLARRKRMESNLISAEEILLEELEVLIGEWFERCLGPSIRELRENYLHIAQDWVEPAQAERAASRFAHPSIKGLRAVARKHGLEVAQTFLEALAVSLERDG